MKSFLKNTALALTACGLIAAPTVVQAKRLSGEEKLAKLLEGREAGEPQRCINTFGNGSLQILDKTAIVYKSGKTVWVNRTKHPESLDDSDYMVIRKFGSASQICRLDNVTTRSRGGDFFSGVVFLEDFVPYKKVDTDEG